MASCIYGGLHVMILIAMLNELAEPPFYSIRFHRWADR